MRVHFILHADFEQPGYYQTWARALGFQINTTQVYKGERLPTVDDFDILMLMGGPQSPRELDVYPYLVDELNLIKTASKADKLIFGICLGAQLIGESYGAVTEQSPQKEIGVFPVTLTDQGAKDPALSHFPTNFQSGHWHNDMPGLPTHAKVLARSQGCPRQIIKFTTNVYGLQCHLEFNQECIAALIENCPEDLEPNAFVQSKNKMLQQNYDEINGYLKLFLDNIVLNNSVINTGLEKIEEKELL